MKYKAVKIGAHVEKVDTWSPAKDLPNEMFSYIDLSSVDKDRKILNSEQIQLIPTIEAPSRARQLVQEKDILVSTVRPNLNGVAYLHQDYINTTASTGYCVLRTKETLDFKFLFYWVRTNSFIFDMVKKASGANYPAVSAKTIKDSKIPLPPLPQQKKIAAILDAADAYRQKTKALIAKYDELTQSLFLDMFGDPVRNEKGWEMKNFIEMAKFDTNMVSDFEMYADLPHVGIKNIEKVTGIIKDCKKVKEEGLTSGKYLFSSEHIIYSKIRPNLNKVALPNFSGLCSADAYPIKPIHGVTNRIFLAFLLRSESFLDFILQHSTRTNIPKANKSQMKLFDGISPPIKLQDQFSERVKAIEVQQSQAQASLSNAEDLFNSLLQKAFKGELS